MAGGRDGRPAAGREPNADRTVKGRSAIPLAAVLLVAASGAGPGGGAASAGEPEPEAALLAAMCGACHGPDGRSPGSIPSLAPLNEEAVRVFLLAYRTGDVEPTVMDRIARALTDAEIEALARHFGNLAE